MAWSVQIEQGFATGAYTTVTPDVIGSTLQISLKRGRTPATCQFTVRDFGAGYSFPLESEVVVNDGSAYAFRGRLRTRQRRDTGRSSQKLWDISAVGYSALAADTSWTMIASGWNRTAETDRARVLFFTLTSGFPYGVDTGDSSFIQNTTTMPANVYRGQVDTILNQICSQTGGEWYIDFDRKLHYYVGNEGLTAPFALSDNPNNSTSFGYDSFVIRDSSIAIKNDIRMDSVALTYSKTLTDSSSISAYGHKMLALDDETLTSTAIVDALVAANLASQKVPTETIGLNCYRPGLRPGQSVTVDHLGWGTSAAYPVAQVDVSVVDPATLRYAVSLGDPPPDVADIMQRIVQGIGAKR